jgi:glycosyltransferase involved in cell wall biosynthesis
LRQHIARLQPQIVHTWQFEANTYGRIAAKRAGTRHLISSERTIERGKVDLQWAIDRRLARSTQRIITNSTAVRDHCIAHRLQSEKFAVIPGAAAAPPASSMSRGELLATLGLPEDAQLIAYVGQLTKHKRLKELIWAMDQLKAVGTQAQLLVVGQGPLQSQLERYSQMNQIESRIHFLGVGSNVHQLLAHVDVLWQAGDCEGQSSAVLEAMAAAIPVIAADAAGNRELVVPGETGFLVPLTERAGFARATLPILEDVALRSRLSAAARERVNRHHHLHDMLAAYSQLYEML